MILAIITFCSSATGAVYMTRCEPVVFPEPFRRFEDCLIFVDDTLRENRLAVITDAGCHRRYGFEL